MKDHAEKKQTPSKATSSKQASTVSRKAFTDNREAAAAQLKLQEAANDYTINKTTIQQKANKTGLPDQLKSGIEQLSGHAMDDVKVHYNSSKPSQLNAHAYAQGSNIHLAPGQEKHLPHEAWHTAQQKQGRVQPTTTVNGQKVNDNPALEKEADVMGAKAASVQMKSKTTKNTNELSSQTVQRVVQRQQTDIALKSASGTYIDNKKKKQTFSFKQTGKGSDIIAKTNSHPKGFVDYSDTIIKYLKKYGEIPKDATGIVLTSQDTYGIKK